MDFPASQLTCFYVVCLAQGFNRATQLYYERYRRTVAESTFSRAVKTIEDALGETCIIREPFQLTRRGQETFDYAKRFVEVATEWQGLKTHDRDVLHLGAPDYCVRAYLLSLQQVLEEKYGIRVQFHTGTEEEIISAVMKGSLHLGVCSLNRPVPRGLYHRPLVEIEPVLLLPTMVGKKGFDYRPIRKAADLLRHSIVPGRLICVDETHRIRTAFDGDLEAMQVKWPERIIVPATALVTMMVASSGHAGLSLDIDNLKIYPGINPLALPGFTPVQYGPICRDPANEVLKKVVKEIELIAQQSNLKLVTTRRAGGR